MAYRGVVRAGEGSQWTIETLAVLFTDIVDSTRRAVELGDQKWRGVLDSHDQLARQSVERHRGTLVKTTGGKVGGK